MDANFFHTSFFEPLIIICVIEDSISFMKMSEKGLGNVRRDTYTVDSVCMGHTYQKCDIFRTILIFSMIG